MRIGVVIVMVDFRSVLRLQVIRTGRLDVDQTVLGDMGLLGRSLAIACTIRRHVEIVGLGL